MRTVLLLLLLAACEPERLVIGPDVPVARDEFTGPPNVLLILTDDQDAKALWVSPTVRSLIGDHGFTFNRAFVTTSVCGPSRVSILRGQYAHNTNVWVNEDAFPYTRDSGLDQSTVATWLHDAGYRTGWVGKYLNFYAHGDADGLYTPPGWDQWTILVPARGRYWPEKILENGVWLDANGEFYNTDYVTERAVDFIHESDGPWFLVVSYLAPHFPAEAAPRHLGIYSYLAGLRPPSFNFSYDSTAPFNATRIAKMDDEYRGRMESLLAVDEGVADLFAAMDSMGVTGNTLVIYTSDNGYLLGEHGFYEKNRPYEEAVRVPMIVRGPGVRQGTSKKIVANIDIAPTIADYAGVAAPSFVDGRSLRPLLENQLSDSQWRKRLLTEHERTTGAGEVVTFASVRTNSEFFTEASNGLRQLFDMTVDTFQLTNKAPLGAGQYATLQAQLAALRVCAGFPCRAAEGP